MNQKIPFIPSRDLFPSEILRKQLCEKEKYKTGGAKISFQRIKRWEKATFQFTLFLLTSFFNSPMSHLPVKRTVKGSFFLEIHSNMMNKNARATFEIPS